MVINRQSLRISVSPGQTSCLLFHEIAYCEREVIGQRITCVILWGLCWHVFPSVKDIVDSKTKSFLVKIIHLFIECAFDGYRIYSLQSSLSTVNLKQKFHLLTQKCKLILLYQLQSVTRVWRLFFLHKFHSSEFKIP